MKAAKANHTVRPTIPMAERWACEACPEVTQGDGAGSEDHGKASTADWLKDIARCLTCPKFISQAETDPRGWGGFVAEYAAEALSGALARSAENMEFFFQIMTSLPDGLLTVSEEGLINYFNPTAQRMTGYRVQDVIGKHCREIFPESVCARRLEGEDLDAMGDGLGTSEFYVRRCGSEPTPVMSSSSLIRDDHGAVVGAVEVFKDISVRRSLEKDLELSERKYRNIFENTKDMIFVLDRNGVLIEANQACVDILDYGSIDDLLTSGSMDSNYMNPLHAKVFRKQIDRWGYIRDFETLFKTRDEVPVHCLVTGNAILDEEAGVIGYEGIAKDITARMHAIQSLQRRHRELSLLNSVALAINAARDLRPALDTSIEKVLEILGASAGAVFLIDRKHAVFPLVAQSGLFGPDWEDACELALNDVLLRDSLLSESVVLPPESTFPLFRGTLRAGPVRQTFPMKCFLIPGKERPLGFIGLSLGEEIHLKDQDLDLLGSLGNFLGGAIDNFMLQKEKKRRSKELKDLTARLFQTRETEREHIARELHDEAGQSLTGINLALDSIKKRISEDRPEVKELISEVRGYINHTYREMRRISHRLHPAILNDLGIEAALDAYFEWFIRHGSLAVDYKVVGFEETTDRELAISLYRLAQEAFTNTQKHANARRFKLSIVKRFPRVIFVAEDDGEGFDPSEVNGARQSLGIVSMRERAEMLGGTFSLRSEKGQGTVLRIEIPLRETSDEVG